MTPHSAIWFGGACLAALLSMSVSIAFADGQKATDSKAVTTQPSPKPDLSPKAVATIVVDALRKNDAKDSGIRLTWEFASPGNQQATGPVERFIPMVKSPAYLPLINSRKNEVHEVSRDDHSAAELVIVTDSNGDKAWYIFQLSKQTEGDLKDCWMTDGVMRVEPKENPNPRAKQDDGNAPV